MSAPAPQKGTLVVGHLGRGIPAGHAAAPVAASEFQAAHITGLDLGGGLSLGPKPTFFAEGYAVSGAVSSYPNLQGILESSSFAVHNHDPFDDVLFEVEKAIGVDHRAALIWPRITGNRAGNANPYRYACKLPALVRDRISECNGQDSYYRLPFEGTSFVSQGNSGTFTHKGTGQYAFDFIKPEGAVIRAARGGVVWLVEEAATCNIFSPAAEVCGGICITENNPNMISNSCPNVLMIRHEDGSFGRYCHMPKDGISVSLGQRVYRGDPVAIVGNTGCSSEPHLHYESRFSQLSSTSVTKFQLLKNGNVQNCYIPVSGETVESNNQ